MTHHLPKLLLLIPIFLTGCPKKHVVEEIGYGELKNHSYTNDYFGLTIHFPQIGTLSIVMVSLKWKRKAAR